MAKLEQKYVNYVRNSINILVKDTGYPVLGKNLTEAGIADRKKLKLLVRKGHIMEMKVRVGGGTILNAYFTEVEAPRAFLKQAEEAKVALAEEQAKEAEETPSEQ